MPLPCPRPQHSRLCAVRAGGADHRGRPHFVAVIRVERNDDGRVATLYIADLAGTTQVLEDVSPDRTVQVQTNVNLVRALGFFLCFPCLWATCTGALRTCTTGVGFFARPLKGLRMSYGAHNFTVTQAPQSL